MQVATKDSVRGDFDDAEFVRDGRATHFRRRGDRFFVTTEGADGRDGEFEVRDVIGVDPLQQVVAAFPGGRVQTLSIAWDTQRKRWFDLYPGQAFAPGSPLHWTGRDQTWNSECAACHTTHLNKGYDAASDSYNTTWSEAKVGCEACHGAGADHLRWSRVDAKSRPADADGLAVRPVGARAEQETCAACHSRRHPVSPTPSPGPPLLDSFMPELLSEDLYQSDGQIREEVYEYGSFLQSRMQRAGVTCSDCHDPHSLALRADGDALCTRCHNETPPVSRFPSLKAARYDAPSHHFHPQQSDGARCVNCHMPARVYMQVDARRDHDIRVPRPDLSQKLGTTDACTGCHAVRDAAWAGDEIAKHRTGAAATGEAASNSDALTALDAHSRGAWPALLAFAGDATQAPIVRASALGLLEKAPPGADVVIANATHDDDGLLRVAAARASRLLAPEERLALLLPLLDDRLRAVRTAAVRMLGDVPQQAIPPTKRASFDRAKAEYLALLDSEADQPISQLNLAALAEQAGDRDKAEKFYARALVLDPDNVPAVMNLSILYGQTGRNADAEGLLRAALERHPDQGELNYSLALLLAEGNHLDEAVINLQKAARALPRQARIRYNLGLALQRVGRRAEAESALLEAHKAEPGDADIMNALSIFYAQQQDRDGARMWGERARAASPPAN